MASGHRSLHAQLTRMNLALVLTTALLALAGTLAVTLELERRGMDMHLREAARIIAQLPQTRRLLEGEAEEPAELLDALVLQSPEMDLILVGDAQGRLYYAGDHALVGSICAGDAYRRALADGAVYVAPSREVEGADRCAFAPVCGETGQVIGFAAVGIYARSTVRLTLATLARYLLVAAAACGVALLLSRRLSGRIKAALMGHEPEGFHRLFRRQQEVLDALEEGILAIDRDGDVIFMNRSAARMMGLTQREEYLGRPLSACDRDSNLPRLLRTGRPEYNVPLDIPGGGQVLSDHVPIRLDGSVAGAVAIFRDRREVTQLAEDLTGVRHMVEAMRAYTHGFMNKLHVIHGLLQLKQYDMAQSYIMDITKTQHQAVSRVMDQIEDPMAAALLVGQSSRASELGISLVLEADSRLSARERFLPSAAFVSILGNLITNAMESLNNATRRSKEILVSIREDRESLLLCVEDTGPGIAPSALPHIFEQGFSTKGRRRGTGLATVRELTEMYHGQIRVESQQGEGAVFYVTFRQPLGEEDET